MPGDLYERPSEHFTTPGQPSPMPVNEEMLALVKKLFCDRKEVELALRRRIFVQKLKRR